MEMANTNLDPDEIERLVDRMFVAAGMERRASLMFEDFQKVLSDQLDMLWDVCLDWKGELWGNLFGVICFLNMSVPRDWQNQRKLNLFFPIQGI